MNGLIDSMSAGKAIYYGDDKTLNRE